MSSTSAVDVSIQAVSPVLIWSGVHEERRGRARRPRRRDCANTGAASAGHPGAAAIEALSSHARHSGKWQSLGLCAWHHEFAGQMCAVSNKIHPPRPAPGWRGTQFSVLRPGLSQKRIACPGSPRIRLRCRRRGVSGCAAPSPARGRTPQIRPGDAGGERLEQAAGVRHVEARAVVGHAKPGASAAHLGVEADRRRSRARRCISRHCRAGCAAPT